MEDRQVQKNGFFSQLMINFAVPILCISFFCYLFGDSEENVSTLFALGNKGIALSTIVQFLLFSLCVTLINRLFLSEIFIKKMMVLWRGILILLSVFFTVVIFIIIFKWFPIDSISGWISFLLSFGVCTLGSSLIMIIKTKREERRYEELLAAYKTKQEKGA